MALSEYTKPLYGGFILIIAWDKHYLMQHMLDLHTCMAGRGVKLDNVHVMRIPCWWELISLKQRDLWLVWPHHDSVFSCILNSQLKVNYTNPQTTNLPPSTKIIFSTMLDVYLDNLPNFGSVISPQWSVVVACDRCDHILTGPLR